MKCWVDIQGSRQFEPNHSGINNPFNHKRANVPGCQFAGFSLEWKITGGQPDLLAGLVVRGWSAMAVCKSLVPSSSASESCPSFMPDSASTPKMPLH